MTSRSDPSSTPAEHAIAEAYRSEWGRLLSALVVRTRRLDLAEDALAEAFARAAARWPSDGVPQRPAAWLYTAAHRTILGRLRAEAVAGRRGRLLVTRSSAAVGDADELPDEQLQLVLLCCHPALHPASRSALALRLVVGTPTVEIARLFLVPTATMAARLTRAKRKIVAAGIPLRLPIGDELDLRLDAVARTVYLAFTAGYAPGEGVELLRADLAGEAVRLAERLHDVAPDAPQVTALLALVLFQHARRDARQDAGALVTLAAQDRRRWHRDEIERAVRLLDSTPPTRGYAEELRLQAAAARQHAIAPSAAETDWAAIAAHYGELERLTGSPVVRLNRAIAVAEFEGPDAGLTVLADLDVVLADSHRFHAAVGELAARAGRTAVAQAAYARAIERCGNLSERRHLAERLDRLRSDPGLVAGARIACAGDHTGG